MIINLKLGAQTTPTHCYDCPELFADGSRVMCRANLGAYRPSGGLTLRGDACLDAQDLAESVPASALDL